ncbi:MAG: hypothetical protein ACTSU5_05170 [Promethearchaeota archaeon]
MSTVDARDGSRAATGGGVLDHLLRRLGDITALRGKTVLHSRPAPHCAVFTLFGRDVDEFVARVVAERAIDQKALADRSAEKVFGDLFPEAAKPLFNVVVRVERELLLDRLRERYPDAVPTAKLEEVLRSRDKRYLRFEIDVCLEVGLRCDLFAGSPAKGPGSPAVDLTPYTLVEVKAFTAPTDDPGKVLRGHLQQGALRDNFLVRDMFGVMAFSYLHHAGERDPVAPNDPRLVAALGAEFTWAVHLALYDRRVLESGKNAPELANELFAEVDRHLEVALDHALPRLPPGERRKLFKFDLTYNILKVLEMTQLMNELEAGLNAERARREEAERRCEDEQKRREEAERRREEEQRRVAELKKMLVERGVSEEEIERVLSKGHQ